MSRTTKAKQSERSADSSFERFVDQLDLWSVHTLMMEIESSRRSWRLSLKQYLDGEETSVTEQLRCIGKDLRNNCPALDTVIDLEAEITHSLRSSENTEQLPSLDILLPQLSALLNAVENRLRSDQYTGHQKAEAYLAYHGNHYESEEDGEALIYLISRQLECGKAIERARECWYDWVRQAARMREASTRLPAAELDESYRDSAEPLSLKRAARILRGRDGVQPFWNMGDLQEYLYASIVRTAEWAGFIGFDEWWQYVAYDVADMATEIDNRVVLAWRLFIWSRSNLLLKLVHPSLAAACSRLLRGESDPTKPWSLKWYEDTRAGVTSRDSIIVAAGLVFGLRRVEYPEDCRTIFQDAAAFLMEEQSPSGGWPAWADDLNDSIQVTAIVVNALAVAAPRGWKSAAERAVHWLWKRQDPLGHWSEVGAVDDICMTTLVMDAIELAAGGTRVSYDLTRKQADDDSRSSGLMAETLTIDQFPQWDDQTRELRWGDAVCKRFRQRAANQTRVLGVFEEEKWPRRIDDPLPQARDMDPKRRLRDTVKALNHNLKHVGFECDGTGEGVIWREVP